MRGAQFIWRRDFYICIGPFMIVTLTNSRDCNTFIAIYLEDFSTLSHILFLRFSALRRLPPEEACHWILSRLQLPAARLSATHDDLRVATLLQIMFAAVTPVPLPPEEACHWILSRLRLPANPVPLPPLEMTREGWCYFSGNVIGALPDTVISTGGTHAI